MKYRFIALLSASILLSGCSWLDFGAEGTKTEIEPAKLVDFDAEIKIRKTWSNGGVGDIDAVGSNLVPALSDGRVYAADTDGNVIAVSAENGKKIWKADLDTSLSGGVGVGSGSIFVGNTDGEVFALDASSGAVQWQYTASSEVLAAPVGDQQIVVVQSQDGRLVGLNAQSGEKLWQFNVDTPVLTLRGTSAPMLLGNTVVAAFANGKIYGLKADTGTQLWENRVAVPQGRTELERMVDVDGQPLLVGDVIYVGSYQGRLTAISRGTGRNLWYQDSSSHRGPAYGLSQVYVSEDGDIVKAFRANSGQVLWSNEQLTYRNLSAPVVAGGYVAVADGEGYLHVMSQTDGRFVGRARVDGSGVNAAMISDNDTLFVLDNDGALTAYRFESR